jgi:hypothetical protein
MKLVSLTPHLDRLLYLPDSFLNSLQTFSTKQQAIMFAKAQGWKAKDVKRVHGVLNGYKWIIVDPHYNAIAWEWSK